MLFNFYVLKNYNIKASEKGHEGTVKLLLYAKADLNIKTNSGRTALHEG